MRGFFYFFMNRTSEIKKNIIKLLREKDYPDYIEGLVSFPLKKVIGCLFSALLNSDERIRWHAVAGFGEVVNILSEDDPEQGRIFVRRLLWMLCDESGGIAWGVPEVMGEVLSKVDILAQEYSSILIHQIIDLGDKTDNFIEFEPLRRGGYWAVARFSKSYPKLVRGYETEILRSLDGEKDPFIILMGLFILNNLNISWEGARDLIRIDKNLQVFWDYRFQEFNIKQIASKVLNYSRR